jgi:hypothetical protein
MIDLVQIKSHLFDREYMSGVERDQTRIKSTGEVFTPGKAVGKMLDMIPADFFMDPTKTAIDPACGDGNWLAEVLWRKLNNKIDFKQALSKIYGVDIMEDNIIECRRRLLCGHTDLELVDIVNRNIVCANSLQYHYRFDGSLPYDPPPVKKLSKKVNLKKINEQKLQQLGLV